MKHQTLIESEPTVSIENERLVFFVRCLAVGLLTVFTTWCGPLARAGTIALQSPCPLAGNQNFGGALGMDFDVLAPIAVTRLGAFDANQDGIKRPIHVYIYNRDSATVVAGPLELAPGDDGTLVCASRFKDLSTPVILNGGFHGTIVAENYGAEEMLRNAFAAGLVYSTIDTGGGRIAFVGSGRYGTATNAFPGTVDTGLANKYHAGTFEFIAAPGPNIVTPPLSQTVPDGMDATLAIIATGAAPLSYQWQFNGVDMPGETGSSLLILNATAPNAGSYRVRIAEANGAIAFSAAASLIVAPPAPVVVYDPATITASTTANNYAPGVGLFFNVVPGTSVWVSDLGTTLYESALTNTVTVQLYSIANTSVLATVTFGAGDTATLVASTPALNLWLRALPNPLWLGPGSYAVALYGTGPGARYANRPTGLTTNGNGAIQHVGSRYVSTSGGPGVLPDTADGAGVTYAGPTLRVMVSGAPVITRQPQGGPFAPGATLSLGVQAGGSLPLSYQWYKDGTRVAGATNATLTVTNIGSLQAGNYLAVIANSIASATSAVATVTVAGAPTVDIQLHAAIILFGTVGLHYRVDYRTSVDPPDSWRLLQDIPSLPTSQYLVYDSAPATQPKRFYRAVLIP